MICGVFALPVDVGQPSSDFYCVCSSYIAVAVHVPSYQDDIWHLCMFGYLNDKSLWLLVDCYGAHVRCLNRRPSI